MKFNTKGNTINVGLINNTAQANTDIKSNLSLENKIEIKTGIIAAFKAVIGRLTYKPIGEFEYYKAKYEYELQKRIEAIPTENITNPRLSVVGPTLDNLKYNLDEEQIREMYINILTSEIDVTKHTKVHPAFLEVIKQISKEDALFIKDLKDTNKTEFPLCNVNTHVTFVSSDYYRRAFTIIIDPNSNINKISIINSSDIVLNNLQRLKIIEITDAKLYGCEKIVEETFNQANDVLKKLNKPSQTYSYTHGLLKITDFGKQFIDICCS